MSLQLVRRHVLRSEVAILLVYLNQRIQIRLDHRQAGDAILRCARQNIVLTRVVAVDGLGAEVLELVLSRVRCLLTREDAFFVILHSCSPIVESTLSCFDIDAAGADCVVFVVVGSSV